MRLGLGLPLLSLASLLSQLQRMSGQEPGCRVVRVQPEPSWYAHRATGCQQTWPWAWCLSDTREEAGGIFIFETLLLPSRPLPRSHPQPLFISVLITLCSHLTLSSLLEVPFRSLHVTYMLKSSHVPSPFKKSSS